MSELDDFISAACAELEKLPPTVPATLIVGGRPLSSGKANLYDDGTGAFHPFGPDIPSTPLASEATLKMSDTGRVVKLADFHLCKKGTHFHFSFEG